MCICPINNFFLIEIIAEVSNDRKEINEQGTVCSVRTV